MSAPPAPMRQMLHTSARRYIWTALLTAIGGTLSFNYFYVWPRHQRYEEFFKNYDPYTRMREICADNKGYMHTCPHELAKMAEEKGKPIAPLH